MNSKTLTIAAVLAAALLAGIFSATTPMAAYAVDDYDDEDHDDEERDNEEEAEDSESSTRSVNDEDDSDNDERDNDMNGDYSATNTEQKLKQTNDGSGTSTNFNCGRNTIDAVIPIQACGTVDLGEEIEVLTAPATAAVQ
jgi:hypothetical protein